MSAPSILRIYLGRHGLTDWNAELRLQGWTDIPLNETGRQQARELADRVRGLPLEAVYCSALRRSRETAEVAAGDVAVVALPEFNEQSMGPFEGRIFSGTELEDFRRRRLNFDDSLDGGESRNQHLARVRRGLTLIRERHPQGGSVLIVGHGGTNNLILQALVGPIEDITFKFHNSDLYLIELPPDRPPLLWKLFPLP